MANRVLNLIVTGNVKGALTSLKTLKGSMLGLAAGTAAVAIAGGVALAKLGDDFKKAENIIKTGTGASGKALKGLNKDFDVVFSTTSTGMDDAATAIADLNTRLGHTGKPLQVLSKQFLDMSRITKTDLGENIASVTRLFGDWSVKTEKQSATLDKLFKLSQGTGIEVSTLARLMVQFGSPLRQLGIDFDYAAAMFARFEKEGVNIESAMPGIKMALKNFAKEGREPAKAFQETLDKIKELGPGSEATTLAMETFGARAGPDLAAAIQEGRFELDEQMKTMKGAKGLINKTAENTETLSDKWTKFGNQLKVAFRPSAEGALESITKLLENAKPVIDFIGKVDELQRGDSELSGGLAGLDKIGDGIANLAGIVNGPGAAIINFFQLLPGRIVGAASAVGNFFTNLPGQVAGGIAALAGAIGSGLLAAGAAVFNFFIGLPGRIQSVVAGFGGLLVGAGASLISGLLHGIANISWPNVIAFLLTLPLRIGVMFTTAGQWLLAKGVELIWGFQSGAISFFTGTVVPWLIALPGRILGYFIDSRVWLWQKGRDVLAGLRSGGESFIVESVIPWLVALPDRVRNWLGNAASWLVQKGRNAISGLLDGIRAFANEQLVPWLVALPGRIRDRLGDAAKWLIGKGGDMIRGLRDGASDAAASIFSKGAKFFVALKDAIVDNIKDIFGIKSPARIMFEPGRQIMMGLAKGVMGGVGFAKGIVKTAGLKVTDVLTHLLQTAPGKAADIIGSLGGKFKDLLGSLFGGGGGGAFSGGGGAGAGRWAGVAAKALQITGQSASWLGDMLKQINMESGGNPGAINRWDSNWKAGTPSVGLLQTIGPTYQRYKHPAYDRGPYAYGATMDPLSNLVAAIRYTVARYGSLGRWRAGGFKGYEQGAWKIPEDQIARLHRGESVLPANVAEKFRQSVTRAAMERDQGKEGTTVVQNFYGITDEHEMMRKGSEEFAWQRRVGG